MNTLYQSGFTLIELLIAIAIVGILVAIALPSYQKYTRRAHYSEIVEAAAPYKIGIEECYQIMGNLNACTAGKNGVPNDIETEKSAGMVNSITVENGGKIIIVPKNKYGIKTKDTYELIPEEKGNVLIWTTTGGGVDKGYAN